MILDAVTGAQSEGVRFSAACAAVESVRQAAPPMPLDGGPLS